MYMLLALPLPFSSAFAPRPLGARVRDAVQPVLDAMALKHNMSFQFGYVDASSSVGLAAGRLSAFSNAPLKGTTQVPLGSVTKPWTALRVMQYFEWGKLSLDDPAQTWVDPVLTRLWGNTLVGLWGANASVVTVRDLLGHTSGFADYDDEELEKLTLLFSGDDVDPLTYLRSAASKGYVCPTRTCAAYSGANYVLLGLVVLELQGDPQWQDLDQLAVVPPRLRNNAAPRRYPQTSFLRLGRCSQYQHIAHQYATNPIVHPVPKVVEWNDLEDASCLNGWTMGNIASTARDLAAFFYDMVTLAPTGSGFVNSSTLALMTEWHGLSDTWCEGPYGTAATCKYGLGLFRDQYAQDWWPTLSNATADIDNARVLGHPGEDWGSGVSPCGYNAAYGFGVCIAYTSLYGMNCSRDVDFRRNEWSIFEGTCLAYDAVLAEVGGPRLNCTIPTFQPHPSAHKVCRWRHLNPGNHTPPHPPHGPPRPD